jgi:predicted secreted hydrolase
MKKLLIILFLVLLISLGWFQFRDDTRPDQVSGTISAAEALQGDVEGYLRADRPIEFEFPHDHGPHPGFRTEWWYYTGNLFSDTGDHFGYQFTIFRSQLVPPDSSDTIKPPAESWQTNQLYMGHVAITDMQTGQHIFEERFSRGAAGLAGARAEPYKIWLENWSAELQEEAQVSSDGQMPMNIYADMDGAALELSLEPAKPLVFHGERGYDRKGTEAGNASYYLSFTRLNTTGTIQIGNSFSQVNGFSWMDHEWSSSALEERQEGWDWFSIQLNNGYDLMYYQLREEDGSISEFTTGTLVDPDGNTSGFAHGDFYLEVLDEWVSPRTGSRYPVRWRLENPEHDIELELYSLIQNQEMNVSFTYYEGAIRIEGRMGRDAVEGHGYVEMTGY